MAAVLLWIVTTAISLLLVYVVVKAAINGSVMNDLYHETRQLNELQSRNAKSLEKLTEEAARIRAHMEEQSR